MGEPLALVVHQINAAHGTAFVLGERAGSGQHGAYRLEDIQGAALVLKWEPGRIREPPVGTLPVVARVLDQLRAAGYPIPRYVAWGVLDAPAGRYTVQERLPGELDGGEASSACWSSCRSQRTAR